MIARPWYRWNPHGPGFVATRESYEEWLRTGRTWGDYPPRQLGDAGSPGRGLGEAILASVMAGLIVSVTVGALAASRRPVDPRLGAYRRPRRRVRGMMSRSK